MGYDCTLHVIDERLIRERFIPRLLGRAGGRSAFDGRDDADELWGKVRAGIPDEPPEVASNYVCQLAITYCASELPYHYERGFCLSLWPEQDNVAAKVPKKFVGNPESLFSELIEQHPRLRGSDWITTPPGFPLAATGY